MNGCGLLAAERRRFGYKRLAIMLRREGHCHNLKKIYRVYKEEGLSVKRRRGRKRAIGTRLPLPRADQINQIWSLDFLSDALSDGRRFRILGIMDQCSRECLSLAVDTSIGGVRVVRELDALVKQHGKPHCIVSDNGTELTSRAVLQWAQDNHIEWHYITPGKPTENGYTEMAATPFRACQAGWKYRQLISHFYRKIGRISRDPLVDGLQVS